MGVPNLLLFFGAKFLHFFVCLVCPGAAFISVFLASLPEKKPLIGAFA